jgi:diguanylate cyclase (GGDEF)-like protein
MADSITEKCVRQLAEIISTLKSAPQYEQVFHLITDRINRMYHTQSCALVVIDPKTEYLHVEISDGLSLTFCKEYRKKVATGAIGKLLWTGEPILISDSSADPDRAADVMMEKSFGSCAILQIAANHRAIGFLYVDSREQGVFTESDIPLLQMFADLAGIALHKYRITERNKRLERVDTVTGLDKYGPFLEKVNSLLQRANSFGERFSLILLDIDNYKQIINTYGLDTGNDLLKEMADLVRSRVRSVDAACRFGVDEFMVVLANTGMQDAVAFASELRRKIKSTPLTGRTIDTSVSIGVAGFPDNGKDIQNLMLTCKHALYEAQRAGRNKVICYRSDWFAGEPLAVD